MISKNKMFLIKLRDLLGAQTNFDFDEYIKGLNDIIMNSLIVSKKTVDSNLRFTYEELDRHIVVSAKLGFKENQYIDKVFANKTEAIKIAKFQLTQTFYDRLEEE